MARRFVPCRFRDTTTRTVGTSRSTRASSVCSNDPVLRRHRDVLVAHEPLALAALEAGGAANPIARRAAARARARDQGQIVAEGRALARHDAQVMELEIERTFERAEPLLEVFSIGGSAAHVERRPQVEGRDIGSVERQEALDVLVADRLGDFVDATAQDGSDGGTRLAIRGHAQDALLVKVAGALDRSQFLLLTDSAHGENASPRLHRASVGASANGCQPRLWGRFWGLDFYCRAPRSSRAWCVAYASKK